MRKVSIFILAVLSFSWLSDPIQVDAALPPMKPITAVEKKMIHQSRIYEDSNETGPVKKSKNLHSKSDSGPQIEAESYILLDQKGKVLASKEKDQPRPPASMTKMMTAYLVMDQIQRKKIRWDDEVVVSKRAASIDEAQIFLLENERISVKELFTGVMVQSGNDAAVALAEYIATSEEEFIVQMNKKAKRLGMKNTHFNNSTGLDHKDYPDPPDSLGDHVMSAADTAKLAQSLFQVHPEIFEFTTITHYTFHPGTDREQKVKNWNRMLPSLEHEYKGVNGIKTGSTSAAGYCFTGTVQRNHHRFLSVVMGTTSRDKRFTETAKLYDYGFQQIKSDEISKIKSNKNLDSSLVKKQAS